MFNFDEVEFIYFSLVVDSFGGHIRTKSLGNPKS